MSFDYDKICRDVLAAWVESYGSLFTPLQEHATALLQKRSASGKELRQMIFRIHTEGAWLKSSDAKTDNPKRKRKKGELKAEALGIFVLHPDWSNEQIADAIVCKPQQLAKGKIPELAAARATLRQDRPKPRGTKRGGQIEGIATPASDD